MLPERFVLKLFWVCSHNYVYYNLHHCHYSRKEMELTQVSLFIASISLTMAVLAAEQDLTELSKSVTCVPFTRINICTSLYSSVTVL